MPHTPRPSLLVILGPTTTGKTELAAELARRLDGALINADKFYLFNGFSVGTGRADVEAHADLPRHLYACVPRDAAPPPVGLWRQWLKTTVAAVRARGRVPVVEGSSFGLASAAAALAARTPGARVLGLRWRDRHGLEQRVAQRVAAACDAGLLAETEAALADGLEDSWVMRKSVVYPHMVAHLRGERTLGAACGSVGAAVVRAARVQAAKFKTVRGVRWFDEAHAALAAHG